MDRSQPEFDVHDAINGVAPAKKRSLKPHPQRNRKRARGGGKVGKTGRDDANSEVQIEILPLAMGGHSGTDFGGIVKRMRVVRPYPFTFATFAKARWFGRSILDVYHKEFGSYPRSYYESAINEGRILVSGRQVVCDYKIRGGDELTHTVHRHEPAVAVSDGTLPFPPSTSNNQSITPLIKVIHEDKDVVVVDKPATLPIHPSGAYNFNSLLHILSGQDPVLKDGLRTVHRLDRLTSGLTILAKSTEVAKSIGNCIKNRKHCHKVYLARVKGKFPTKAARDKHSRASEEGGGGIPYQYGESHDGRPALGYWVTDNVGNLAVDAELEEVFEGKRGIDELLEELKLSNEEPSNNSSKKYWFHLACPCRVVVHKKGICEAGEFDGLSAEERRKSVKAAETAFAVISYDRNSDSTVVMCKPETGRTHQIRLHLQWLGHPIANDPNYGGELWYFDPNAERSCEEARKEMEAMDQNPYTVSTDTPATEEELGSVSKPRENGESLISFIKKTCVWCSRSKGGDRTLHEFMVRSRGLWLHALQYELLLEEGKKICYRTKVPVWAVK